MKPTSLSVKLREFFAPYVGCKIIKADGTLLKAIKDQMPEMPSTPRLHVYRNSSDYTLGWTVKTCVSDDRGHAQYYDITVYVGDMGNNFEGKGHLLAKLSSPFEARTDFTVEEVEGKRQRYKEVKKIADDAFSALHPFGENDR
jgi:hypothetical protein